MEARGIRNHNPLNIRKGNDWKGEHPTLKDDEFETFINDAYGFRAGFRIIHNGFKATPPRNTIRKIIERWAPESDGNDTERYIQFVSKYTQIPADQKLAYIDSSRLVPIVRAMALMETGKTYSEEIILSGYNLEK